MTFVITGTLDSMSREEAQEALVALAPRFPASVSKKTRYVVVGAEAGNLGAQRDQRSCASSRLMESNVPVITKVIPRTADLNMASQHRANEPPSRAAGR